MQGLDRLTDTQRLAFTESLFAAFGPAPLGALSKTELDFQLFVALMKAGYVSLDKPLFVTARALQISPARVNTLLYTYRMRFQSAADELDELAKAIAIVDLESGKEGLTLNVEDRYWRETLIARLKESDIYTNATFNRERLTLSDEKFEEFLGTIFGARGTKLVKALETARKKNSTAKFGTLVKKLALDAGTGAVQQGASLTIGYLLGLVA
jgi:hypothetical protein